MAWNRPTKREREIGNRERENRKFPFRGLVAGLIVVIGAAVAWLLWRPDATPPPSTSTSTSTSLIKDVGAVVTNVQQVAKPSAPQKLSAEDAMKLSIDGDHGFPMVVKDENGVEWYRGVKVPLDPPGTIRRNGKIIGPRMYSRKKTENYLVNMYLTGRITGPATAAKETGDEFYEALERDLHAKVEILDSDDDDAKEVKTALQKVKDVLLERVNKGEKLKDIIVAEREEQEKVARARANYQQMFEEMLKKEDTTIQDLDDFVKAANDILGDNNAMPLHVSPAVKAKILKNRKEKANE